MRSIIIALFGLLLLPLTGYAENSTAAGDYTIHHNALTTDTLSPQVAASYGIQRSNNRGMVTVSIVKKVPGTTGEPVAGKISMTTRNLMGQPREIPLREVREGKAIYYIADFPVANREHLIFDISAMVPGESYPLKARFEQEFFTE